MKSLQKVHMLALCLFTSLGLFAQESTQTISYTDFEQLQSDNVLAKRFKITGYVQTQFQLADTAGINSYAGGNFSSNLDNRFMVRRGRLKFAYTFEDAQAVVQYDLSEKGFALKDAWVAVMDPWLKTIKLTAGSFDRPFGYEISYSSSTRESPERARIFQTLFPGELDLGAKLTIQGPKTSSWNFLKLDLGLFNGNGVAVETDRYKDFIGHLSIQKTSTDEKLSWGLGASYYLGGYALATTKRYAIKETAGVKAFELSSVKVGDQSHREYVGIDGQLSYDWEPGMTQVRAEYLRGSQPGSATSSTSLTAAASGDVYNRNFNGWYVYLIQNILESPLQVVVKYDVYDPNTDVSGNQIGAATIPSNVSTGATDIKYSTLGVGLNYVLTPNAKLLAYYDAVKNETTSNIPFSSTLKDLSHDRKDNVLTLRLQYKF